jgi:hypothetical protein
MGWSSTGATQWIFEYVNGGVQATTAQRRTFWAFLAGAIGIWIMFCLFVIVRLSLGWCVVNAIDAALAGAMAAKYWYCDRAVAQDIRRESVEFYEGNLMLFARTQAENILFGTEEPRAAALENASDE